MRTRRLVLALLALLALASPAAAAPLAITREDQREVMVTIYNGNLGLVKDVREARLPTGATEVWFMDVAARIDPTTVHLKSLTAPSGLKILEQNYEYDLLSSEKLLEKYIGKKVRIYQGDGTYHEATLLTTRGRSSRSTARSTSATTAAWCCRRSPRTWWPSRRSPGSCATRRRPASGWRRRI